jgi:hypothetical protein
MEITTNKTEYKVEGYRIEIEKDFKNNKSSLTIWDSNNNILNTFDSVDEALKQCRAIIQVTSSIHLNEKL